MGRVTTAFMSYKDKIAEIAKSVNALYDNGTTENGISSAEDAPSTVSNIWTGSQAQYDAITTKDAETLYFIV